MTTGAEDDSPETAGVSSHRRRGWVPGDVGG